MEWFVEDYDGSALRIAVKRKLIDLRSNFQKIEIYETVSFGKMLVLDGKVQLTEKDEAFYHEMLVHVPMFSHENPRKVLIIGGGDGGSLRETLKHEPDEVVMVELDETVVELSKKFLKIDRGAFDDPRVTILYEDGYEFLKSSKENFDVIIVDGTDPNAFSLRISTVDFYKTCKKRCDVFATQSQSPFAQEEYFKQVISDIKKAFEDFAVYLGFVPTYPLGMWSYTIAKEFELNVQTLKKRFEDRKVETRYYTPEVHVASFSLPKWVQNIISSV